MSDELKAGLADEQGEIAETGGDSNSGPEGGPASMAAGLPEEKERALANQVAGRTRFVATVPATGLLIASVVMGIGTVVTLVITAYEFVIGDISLHELTIEYVEYADAFLLAVALYILSIGLLSLFVSDKIPLPSWLEIHDFDDLKELLCGIIIVMIGVSFLGHVLKDSQGIDALWLGLGSAAMVAALSLFMRAVFKFKE